VTDDRGVAPARRPDQPCEPTASTVAATSRTVAPARRRTKPAAPCASKPAGCTGQCPISIRAAGWSCSGPSLSPAAPPPPRGRSWRRESRRAEHRSPADNL